MARQRSVEVGRLGDAAAQQRIEVHAVALLETFVLAHVGVDGVGVGARQQPFVEALHRQFARPAALRLGGRAALRTLVDGLGVWLGGRLGLGRCHDNSSIKLAISMATRAASRPLSSTRAQAWASFSTVRTAFAMGTWWSSCTRVMPAPLSLATSSKW